jgi:hypothetical protein
MNQNQYDHEEDNAIDGDAEALVEGSPSPQQGYGRRGMITYVVLFTGLILLVSLIYAAWYYYLSPEAHTARELNQSYQQYQEWEQTYEAAMRADTYGGSTPQETLDLFVAALEQGDLELASKYFVLEESGTRDPKWLEALQVERSSESLPGLISLLKTANSAGSSTNNRYGFNIFDSENILVGEIDLILNKYSNVWKIESL